MTTTALPIAQMLKGHTQSLFQALRLLSGAQRAEPEIDIITIESLLSQIQNIPSELDSSDASPSGDKLVLRRYLQSIARQVAPDLQASLLFIDLLISELTLQTKPHPAITSLSRKISLMIGCRLLTRPDIAITASHSFCRLIQNFYQQLAIWEPSAGKQGKAFAEWLRVFNAELPSLDINSTSQVEHYSNSLKNLVDTDHERSHKVEQRLLETVSGTSALESARNTVIEFTGRRLTHRPLPEDISLFIQNTLISDLQYRLINDGVDCDLWKKWKRLLQVFSWAFQANDNESHRTKVSTLLPPLIEKLDKSYWQDLPKADQYPDFISSVQHYFLKALTSTPITTVPFPDILPTSNKNPHTAMINQSIEVDLSHIKKGDWFQLHRENATISKGKLLKKSSQQDSLLLTKYGGQKIAEYSFDEFSVGLLSRSIVPLNHNQLYGQALRTTLQRLENFYQKYLQAEQHRAISEVRRLAALKAQNEAQSLKQQAENLPEISENLRSALQQKISQLNVGAWLKWQRTGTEQVEIKLSVKLQNSDKYIFTDRLGQRIADYSLAQLAELMAQKQITILSQGENFESSLEKVVRGLRKPIP